MALLLLLALIATIAVDSGLRASADSRVRAAFVAKFAARAAAFGPFVDRLATGLRMAADAVSTHGALPDSEAFGRVRCKSDCVDVLLCGDGRGIWWGCEGGEGALGVGCGSLALARIPTPPPRPAPAVPLLPAALARGSQLSACSHAL